MSLRFGEFVLDRERYRITRGGTSLEVEPQVFEVLVHLVEHRDHVVTRSELIDAVWKGRVVSDAALSRAIREVRRVLGDSGAESRWVKTIYGRGFRFVGEVTPSEPHPESPADAAPLRPTAPPSPLTVLVGRERELAETARLLETGRLLTLTGAAGAGKSRLALALAERVAGRFSDGTAFVPLSRVASPDLVPGAIALALGASDAAGGSTLESLQLHLRDARLLLLLDDFERVAEAGGDVATLLRACPGVVAVVTSRFVLHAEGEQEYPVSPLALPGRDAEPEAVRSSPAVSLFLARARAALPDFDPAGEDLAYVAEICQRLDGLPLAIELAAARVKLLPPRALWERLASRFDLLSSPARSKDHPHRTLAQALDWSYDLLDEAERSLLRHLAVFSGGFSLSAAEVVCDTGGEPVIDALAGLVDKSLVERQAPVAGEPRFRLLETTRRHAHDRLEETGEAATLCAAHARWALGLARAGGEALAGGDQRGWLERLDAEYGNLAAAMAWARRGGDPEIGIAIAAAISRYWSARGAYREGCAELDALLHGPGAEASDAVTRADGLVALGLLTHLMGRYSPAASILEEARQLLQGRGERSRLAAAEDHLAWIALQRGRLEEAETLARHALTVHEQVGEVRGAAVARNNLGWIAFYTGRAADAEASFLESLEGRREIADGRGAGFTLGSLAMARLVLTDDLEGVEDWIREARRLIDALMDPPLQGWVACAEAAFAVRRGDPDRALVGLEANPLVRPGSVQHDGAAWVWLWRGEAHRAREDTAAALFGLEQARATWERLDCPWGVAYAGLTLARVHQDAGDAAAASRLFRDALELSERCGFVALAERCRRLLGG